MGFEILPSCLCFLYALANSFSGRDHKQNHVIASAFFCIEHIITQAKPIRLGLTAEFECMLRRNTARSIEMNRIAIAFSLKKLPNAARLHPLSDFLFYVFYLMK